MRTEILVITDRSGSMGIIRGDVIGGYNTFLEEQKKVPGEAKVTFTQFNTSYEVVYAGKLLAEAEPLSSHNYVPSGNDRAA